MSLKLLWVISLLHFAVCGADSEPHFLSDEYIESINAGLAPWTAGRNFPKDTPEAFIKSLTHKMKPSNVYLEDAIYDPESLRDLPDEFDARKKWPHCPTVGEIRHQGKCGSGWAVASVQTMNDRVCISSNGTKTFSYSAQDLLTCCYECGDCAWSKLYSAWQQWKYYGIVTGGDYGSKQGCRPYDISKNRPHRKETPDCEKKCVDGYNTTYEKDKHYAKNIYKVGPGERVIRAEIFKNGPVAASFRVYDDFNHYKSGIYSRTTSKTSGHQAVKIIGWGEEEGWKYWLCTNSWGKSWGDQGTFKILRGENESGIEESVVAGRPK